MEEIRDLSANAILANLPPDELEPIRNRAELFELGVGDMAYEAGRPIEFVYFPLDAVFSVVATTEERPFVEVATIGREGMVGLPLFLGTSTSPQTSFCQVPGPTLRLRGADLARVLRADGVLHRVLNRFVQATMVQMAQNVACNNTHSAEQRAARWLLTTQDRVHREQFRLTQQFLAQMLGVRRPTASTIAARLAGQGLIRYRRGMVMITDRGGLERSACNCYWIVRREFEAIATSGV